MRSAAPLLAIFLALHAIHAESAEPKPVSGNSETQSVFQPLVVELTALAVTFAQDIEAAAKPEEIGVAVKKWDSGYALWRKKVRKAERATGKKLLHAQTAPRGVESELSLLREKMAVVATALERKFEMYKEDHQARRMVKQALEALR